jgi:hypothetical protein
VRVADCRVQAEREAKRVLWRVILRGFKESSQIACWGNLTLIRNISDIASVDAVLAG